MLRIKMKVTSSLRKDPVTLTKEKRQMNRSKRWKTQMKIKRHENTG